MVLDRGNVIPFARGGLVDRPTIFPMARGYGLMGEAGPEAVVPLKRLPSGNLGVEAGGGPRVTVNVINNAGAKVSTEQKPDGRGGLTIDVMVDAVEQMVAQRLQRPGTTLNRALGSEPEGLCVNSDGVVTLRVGDVGIRLTLRVQDAHAISAVLTEFVAKSILLDIAQPQGRA